jgi:hypothetical protein
VAALLLLAPGWRPAAAARGSVVLGFAGVALMLAGAGVADARPLLSNYIPTIDHWSFRLGQICFAAAVVASVVDRRRVRAADRVPAPLELPPAARAGLAAIAAALLLAAASFALTALALPAGLAPEAHYELLVWGGGHVLQLASSAAMVTLWIALVGSALGAEPVSGRGAAWLFLALVLPWSVSPWLALQGGWSEAYRAGFTRLMQWGLAPVITLFGGLCASALARAWRAGDLGRAPLLDPRVSAFVVSLGLTLLGFALGASIRGSNTMVPAHYHASVGGVTVAFMAATYLLLPALGRPLPAGRLRRAAAWQPLVYGVGMLVFAAGFAFAGAHGMGRKVYGAEQAARGWPETLGLVGMGVGGFVAMAGGILFLAAVGAAWFSASAHGRSAARASARLTERWRYGTQGNR